MLSGTSTKESSASFPLIRKGVGKYWVCLMCLPRAQPSHLHMSGEARVSSCSPNQLSLRCGWLQADVCFSFWHEDCKCFFKCFLHLLIILAVLYILQAPFPPFVVFSSSVMVGSVCCRSHDSMTCACVCVCVYMRCLGTLLRLCWTSLFRATQHFREVTCHHDAWGLIWHQASYSRSSAAC